MTHHMLKVFSHMGIFLQLLEEVRLIKIHLHLVSFSRSGFQLHSSLSFELNYFSQPTVLKTNFYFKQEKVHFSFYLLTRIRSAIIAGTVMKQVIRLCSITWRAVLASNLGSRTWQAPTISMAIADDRPPIWTNGDVCKYTCRKIKETLYLRKYSALQSSLRTNR